MLCFEWKIGKFDNVRIFKHKILIMASKKKRNHYDLKETENYCRTITFRNRLAGKGEKASFRRTAKRLSIKKWTIILQREQTCHCR